MKVYDMTAPGGKAPSGQYMMLASDLSVAPIVHTGEWQSMNTRGSKPHGTHELEDVILVFDPLPKDLDHIMPFIDHDWADNHFLERVSGRPLNPPPSHEKWPYAVRNNSDHTPQGRFDHTYPERFWPKHAGDPHTRSNCPYQAEMEDDQADGYYSSFWGCSYNSRQGIRFSYGDLQSVVDLLVSKPLTRQAFLPIWFPEDTGAVMGQRVPCTLGYHFMRRGNWLSCRYYLRSCDIYRHLSNDVYFAAMLTRWISKRITLLDIVRDDVVPGRLMVYISSLHEFVGDSSKMNQRLKELP